MPRSEFEIRRDFWLDEGKTPQDAEGLARQDGRAMAEQWAIFAERCRDLGRSVRSSLPQWMQRRLS